MQVVLIDCTSMAGCYEAAGVCQGARDSVSALNKALARGHSGLKEHWVGTFRVDGISRACSHQLVRNRIASYAQASQRVLPFEEYVVPDIIQCNKAASREYDKLMTEIHRVYTLLQKKHGIPMEDARYVTPNAAVTSIIITMNARALNQFFKDRLCMRAQWEIRKMAGDIHRLCKDRAPELFTDSNPLCKGCKDICDWRS